MERVDVVVVGGGIAGAALATVLASTGIEVVVLEATEQFDDRVRGESMQPWGVREAQRLGVADALLAAGAHVSPIWHRYAEGGDEPRVIPMGLLVPGVDGALNLHHPVACQALLDAAVRAGASVCRGVTEVSVAAGATPTVGWREGDSERVVSTTLVVGADGRSSVVRRAAGIDLQRQEAQGFIAGLLLDGGDCLPVGDHDILAEHERGLFLLFHQQHGRARAYHVVGPDDRTRYAGDGGAERFLADIGATDVPGAAAVASARPVGPCAAFPGTDTWTERPFADGVVLIGDAAGHNDPTAGCGLSIALRDARMVAELVTQGARRPAQFESYGIERTERMRRLRLIADLVNVASVEPSPNRRARRRAFADAMSAMDPEIFPLILGMFAGPETVPDECVDERVLARLRAAS